MKKQIFLVSLLMTILMVAFFSPATAQTPVTETFEFQDVFSFPCNGFNAEFDDLVKGRVTTFSDENNNPNEYVGQLRFDGTITHSGTGQSFRDHAVVNFRGKLDAFDELDDDRHGVFFNLKVPGKGFVTLAVGRIVTDENGNAIFTSGQNTARLNEQGLLIVCEGLASL